MRPGCGEGPRELPDRCSIYRRRLFDWSARVRGQHRTRKPPPYPSRRRVAQEKRSCHDSPRLPGSRARRYAYAQGRPLRGECGDGCRGAPIGAGDSSSTANARVMACPPWAPRVVWTTARATHRLRESATATRPPFRQAGASALRRRTRTTRGERWSSARSPTPAPWRATMTFRRSRRHRTPSRTATCSILPASPGPRDCSRSVDNSCRFELHDCSRERRSLVPSWRPRRARRPSACCVVHIDLSMRWRVRPVRMHDRADGRRPRRPRGDAPSRRPPAQERHATRPSKRLPRIAHRGRRRRSQATAARAVPWLGRGAAAGRGPPPQRRLGAAAPRPRAEARPHRCYIHERWCADSSSLRPLPS